MKYMKPVFALGILALSAAFMGCVETTSQTCTDAVLEDVPGFEGNHTINFLNGEFKMESKTFQIDHLGTGLYSSNNSQQVTRTCRLGPYFVTENKTEYGTYQLAVIESNGKGFSSSPLVIGAEVLSKLGIPFEIIERESNSKALHLLSSIGIAEKNAQRQKVMVLDNSGTLAKKVLEKYSRAQGIGFIFE